jgi:SAM-dependent methyltransferase
MPMGLHSANKSSALFRYCSDPQLGTVRLPRRYDLIWCGSLLTHLPQRSANALLRLFSEHLTPNGLCVFSTHGEAAVKRLTDRVYSYGLDEDQRVRLLRQISADDYAFCELQPGYGIAFATAASTRALAKSVGGWSEAHFREHGWDDHQDVFAFKSGEERGALATLRPFMRRLRHRLRR